MPKHPGPDFLREAMKATLKKGPVTYKFLIQPKTAFNQRPPTTRASRT
jgi:hypothetical protein